MSMHSKVARGTLSDFTQDGCRHTISYEHWAHMPGMLVFFNLDEAQIVYEDSGLDDGENAYFVEHDLRSTAPLARAWGEEIQAIPWEGDTQASYRVRIPSAISDEIEVALRAYLGLEPGDDPRDSLLYTASMTAPATTGTE